MKSIDVFDLIYVLSDVGLASTRTCKMIKAGGIRRWAGANMSVNWTSGRRIGRCVGRRLHAMNSGIKPRRADIMPKRSELRSQHAD